MTMPLITEPLGVLISRALERRRSSADRPAVEEARSSLAATVRRADSLARVSERRRWHGIPIAPAGGYAERPPVAKVHALVVLTLADNTEEVISLDGSPEFNGPDFVALGEWLCPAIAEDRASVTEALLRAHDRAAALTADLERARRDAVRAEVIGDAVADAHDPSGASMRAARAAYDAASEVVAVRSSPLVVCSIDEASGGRG